MVPPNDPVEAGMSLGADPVPNDFEAGPSGAGVGSAECEWHLPSGEDLIAFALATGFTARALTKLVDGSAVQDRPVPGPAASGSRGGAS